jgi:hypothetical protein
MCQVDFRGYNQLVTLFPHLECGYSCDITMEALAVVP